ncbi:MAG: alpha/beta hydrolase [Micropruina sp.]|nr:alpha/beta hydrolase [Micropruina sp.]
MNPYAAFLPAGYRDAAGREPERTWWRWRGHDVHLVRARQPRSPVRLLVVHGVGGHSGALWPIAAVLADRGLEVAAVDLPLYGRTTSPDPGGVRYHDWVGLLTDLVDAEQDGRPLVLLGASLGGLLAYEVAARSPGRVAAVAATCLLDPRDPRARARMTRFGPLGVLARPLSALVIGRLADLMLPVGWVADLARMSLDPALSRLCAQDPRGGGARIPLGFLASYLRFEHAAPEGMRTPVTLLHPGSDTWTPVALSTRFLRRMAGPTELVLLPGCGHFPIEEPGFTGLITAVTDMARTVLKAL